MVAFITVRRLGIVLLVGLSACGCRRSEARSFDFSLIRLDGQYDVTDYFLMLPYDALGVRSVDKRRILLAQRRDPDQPDEGYTLQTLDISRSHLRMQRKHGDCLDVYDVKIWRAPGLPDTVGVNFTVTDQGRISSRAAFFRFEDNSHWVVVTPDVFPQIQMPAGASYEIVFPDTGSDILVRNADTGTKLMLAWGQGRFETLPAH